MIRVLHLVDTSGAGGAESVFVELATRLDPSRFESFSAVPSHGWVFDALVARGMTPELMRSRRSADLGFFAQLYGMVRRHRIDVIHAHLLTTSLYGGLVGSLQRVPSIATFHGMVDVAAPHMATKCRLINLAADRIVFVSDSLRKQLVDRAGLSARKAEVVYNGVDTARFSPAPDRSWRRALGIADDEILVGGVGRIAPAKGFDLLVRAIAKLRATDPRFRLVIVGDVDPTTDANARLHALRAELGLEDAVQIVGFEADVPRVFRSLDLFAMSSRTEGFSLATVEAQACGVPVVATRCGGPEEIVTDGRDGLMIPTDDVDALAEALARLAGDPALRKRLTAAGLETARTRFSNVAMLSAYSDLYERLAR